MQRRKLLDSVIIALVAISVLHIQANEGASANVAMNAYLIRPGMRVGNVPIGGLRRKVRSLIGEPLTSLKDGEQFSDFTVRYEDDRVVEIIIVSPRYHTVEGISVKSTPEQFLKTYPKSETICYVDAGANSITNGRVLDERRQGIAFDQQTFEGRSPEIVNSISVHRVNVPAKIFGELRHCEK